MACARKCYLEFPTIVNNIQKDKNQYKNNLLNYANIDNKLSHAQSAIGLSSNLAQFAQTYMYNFDDQKYIDYVCILSVLAQCAIDNAKRTFDVDLVGEIDRITKDMNIEANGYPIFWKHIKDKKAKVGDKLFDYRKINKELVCPMNYLMNLKFENFRSNESTLPMSHFFNKYELETNRRQSKKVEELIEKYSFDLYNKTVANPKGEFTDYGFSSSDNLLLMDDFDMLIDDIKTTYISSTYIGLMSWLIDRAFLITPNMKSNTNNINVNTNKNKSLLLKVLYDVNSKNILKIFSKNA